MGVIAQANASEIYLLKEVVWGTPATGTFNTVRVTSARFRQTNGTVTSNIINPTREPGDVIRVDLGAEGSIDFEMDLRFGTPSVSAFGPENLWNSLFGNEISAALGISANIDVVSVVAGDSVSWRGTGSTFANVRIGDWVLGGNFALTANNGWYYVANKIGDDILVKNPTGAAETNGVSVTVEGFRYVFGSTLIGYTIEQKVPTETTLFHRFTGMTASSLSLNIAPGSLITGSLGFIGKRGIQATTTGSAATPIAASTAQILNAVDHVTAVFEGRQGLTEVWKVASLTLNIANDFAPRNAVSNLGAVSIRMGRANVTGNMRIYVEHGPAETGGIKDIVDSYLAGTSRAESASIPGGLGIVVTDTGSPTIYSTLMLHEYQITNAQVAVGGNNEDLFLDVEFAAQVHPSTTGGPGSLPVAFSVHRSS